MKTLLISSLFFIGFFFFQGEPKENMYYICKNSNIPTYHSYKDCKVLVNCHKTKLHETSLDSARRFYRKTKLCAFCLYRDK